MFHTNLNILFLYLQITWNLFHKFFSLSVLIFVAETISVDQTVAQVFRLRPYQDVHVNVVDPKVCGFETFFHLSCHLAHTGAL